MARETEAPQFAERIGEVSFRGYEAPGVVDNSEAVKIQGQTAAIGKIGKEGLDAYKGYELARVERETEGVIEDYMQGNHGLSPFSREERQNLQPVLEEHLGEITKLQGAYTQGAMSKDEFQARMTSVTKDATNRAPGFFPDIVNHTKKVLELSGINQIIDYDVAAAKADKEQMDDYSDNVLSAADEVNLPVDFSQARNPAYLMELNRKTNDILEQNLAAKALDDAAKGKQAIRDAEAQQFIDSGGLARGVQGTLAGFTTAALDTSNAISSGADYSTWLTEVKLKSESLKQTFFGYSAKYLDNSTVAAQKKFFEESLDRTVANLENFKSGKEAAAYLKSSLQFLQDTDTIKFREITGMSSESMDLLIQMSSSPNLAKLFRDGKGSVVANVVNSLEKVVGDVTTQKLPNGRGGVSEVSKQIFGNPDHLSSQKMINKIPAAYNQDSGRAKSPQERFRIQDEYVTNLANTNKEGVAHMDDGGKNASINMVLDYSNSIISAMTRNLSNTNAEVKYLENGSYVIAGDLPYNEAAKYVTRLNNSVRAVANLTGQTHSQVAQEHFNERIFGGSTENKANEGLNKAEKKMSVDVKNLNDEIKREQSAKPKEELLKQAQQNIELLEIELKRKNINATARRVLEQELSNEVTRANEYSLALDELSGVKEVKPKKTSQTKTQIKKLLDQTKKSITELEEKLLSTNISNEERAALEAELSDEVTLANEYTLKLEE